MSVIKPALSYESEQSMWGEEKKGRVNVSHLAAPSALDVRLRIPKERMKWHFDDSDDEEEEEARAEVAAKSAQAAKEAKAVAYAAETARLQVNEPDGEVGGNENEEPDFGAFETDAEAMLPSKERHRLKKEREHKAKQQAEAKAKLARKKAAAASKLALALALTAAKDAKEGRSQKDDEPFVEPWVEATSDLFEGARANDVGMVEEALEALMVVDPSPEAQRGKYGGVAVTGNAVDLQDDPAMGGRGFTALMYACEENATAVASYLVKKAGAAVEVCDPLGLTALHVASAAGSLECVQLLVHFAGKGKQSLEGLSYDIFRGHGFASGADATPRRPEPTKPRQGEEEWEWREREEKEREEKERKEKEAAAEAAAAGKKRSKAPLPPKNGTALYWAAAHGRLAVVQYLVEAYKPLMDESQNEEGDSPLWAAIFHRRLAVAKYLLEAGADAIAANVCGGRRRHQTAANLQLITQCVCARACEHVLCGDACR
jgi:hypothetical protein